MPLIRNWSEGDFTDEPVNFEIPILHRYETFKNLTVEQRESLISEGAVIKYGKFSKKEDRRILKNLRKFIKKFDFEDIDLLLGIASESNNPDLLRFKKAKHFPLRLGKGLNDRILNAIYKRARRLLKPSRKGEQLNKKDIEAVKLLQKFVGNKWSLIGKKVGVSSYRCSSVHRWHEKEINKGKWSRQEIESLINAVKAVSDAVDIKFVEAQAVPWDEVANIVGSRNSSQCRTYWLTNLAWSCDVEDKKSWDKECCKKLIRVLSESNVDDENKINWKDVHKHFLDCTPSYYVLQKKWAYLKRRFIPSNMEDFLEIIEALKTRFCVH